MLRFYDKMICVSFEFRNKYIVEYNIVEYNVGVGWDKLRHVLGAFEI